MENLITIISFRFLDTAVWTKRALHWCCYKEREEMQRLWQQVKTEIRAKKERWKRWQKWNLTCSFKFLVFPSLPWTESSWTRIEILVFFVFLFTICFGSNHFLPGGQRRARIGWGREAWLWWKLKSSTKELRPHLILLLAIWHHLSRFPTFS